MSVTVLSRSSERTSVDERAINAGVYGVLKTIPPIKRVPSHSANSTAVQPPYQITANISRHPTLAAPRHRCKLEVVATLKQVLHNTELRPALA
jgi:hypothetical protein